MNILCISEMALTNNDKICSKDKTMLYSGHQDQCMRSFGLVLGKEGTRSLIERKAVNERIIMARFQEKRDKTTTIQAYAPSEDTKEAEEDKFYDQLQNTINSIPSYSINILIGGMNAQVSNNRQGVNHAIGSHATARRTNDNGERLLLFCNINNLCIGNTYFEHKNIHKKTWRLSDRNTSNEIEYIYISKR